MDAYHHLNWERFSPSDGERSVFIEIPTMISSWIGDATMTCCLNVSDTNAYIGAGKQGLLHLSAESRQAFDAWSHMSFPDCCQYGDPTTSTGDIPRSHFAYINSILMQDIAAVNTTSQIIRFEDVFLIPPFSAFCQSQLNRNTMSQLGHFMKTLGCPKTDVIIMDPPWPSKSVNRRRAYETLSLDALKDNLLTLGDNLCWNGLVAVWVTNNPAISEFVISRLFPSLGVVPIQQWAWVKLTSTFSPVIPWGNKERKPYERVLVGIKNDLDYQFDLGKINRFLFSQVSIHSLKPSLDVFIDALMTDKLVKPKYRVELFARNIKQGYLAWGNQALLLQHDSLWKKK